MRILTNGTGDLLTREHLAAMAAPVNIHMINKATHQRKAEQDVQDWLELAVEAEATGYPLAAEKCLEGALDAEKDARSIVLRSVLDNTELRHGE